MDTTRVTPQHCATRFHRGIGETYCSEHGWITTDGYHSLVRFDTGHRYKCHRHRRKEKQGGFKAIGSRGKCAKCEDHKDLDVGKLRELYQSVEAFGDDGSAVLDYLASVFDNK